MIASENFPHKTQHSIKNRVVSLLTNYSCDNRKEVHEILKHDFSPYVGKALEKIKKDRNYDKMKQKKEKNIKEEAIQIKKEKETNEKEKQQIENSQNIFFNLSIDDINYYNNIFQTHMNLYFNNGLNQFANYNFNNMFMFKNPMFFKQEDFLSTNINNYNNNSNFPK